MENAETIWRLFNSEGLAWLLLWGLPSSGGGLCGDIDTNKELVGSVTGSTRHGLFLSVYFSFGYRGFRQAFIRAHDTWSEPLDTVQTCAVPRVAGIILSYAISVARTETISLPLWNTVHNYMSTEVVGGPVFA